MEYTKRSIMTTFDGYHNDVWPVKVSNLLKLQDMWHFIVEEDPKSRFI